MNVLQTTITIVTTAPAVAHLITTPRSEPVRAR
jgi:hypothetical protein